MNKLALAPDDPRLTAYALGECSPAEREAVEQLLAASPEARAEVERTAALARDLEAEFRDENEAYWDARHPEPSPGKVVSFPRFRQTGSNRTVALAWKIAAVVMALGALTPLALRRTPLPPVATVVAPRQTQDNSAQPAAAAPALAETSPTAGNLAQADVPMDSERAVPSAAAPEPAAAVTTQDADAMLALNTDRARRDEAGPGRAASRQTAPDSNRTDAPKPSVQRPAAALAPAPSAPGASTSGSAGGTVPSDDRISRSLVRIRTADGSLVGGVVVTADGGVLAAQPLPAGETQATVILADGREVSATLTCDVAGSGLCRLQVDGADLPSVAFAMTMPADKAALSFVATDPRTGATRFSRARAVASGGTVYIQWSDHSPSTNESGFVFNSDSELLSTVALPPSARTELHAKSAPGRRLGTDYVLRPFTTAERVFLETAPRKAAR